MGRKKLDNLSKRILYFLKMSPNTFFNISELARAVGKSSPTITKTINELAKQNKVLVVDKKSMKLVRVIS